MKWFNREFYDHLWNIDEKYGDDWIYIIPDDDPDLIYCRNTVRAKDKQSIDERRNNFISDIRNILNNTRINRVFDLARELGLDYKSFLERVRKFNIEIEVKHIFVLRNGYVLVEDGLVKLISGNKSNLCYFVNASRGKVNEALDSGEKINGCEIYRYETWFKQNNYTKDIELTKKQRKELVNARITKISA
ncbi:hypothetical protein AB9M75_04295 [Lactobacillus sp. AN1001]